jgi:hypothetical protein
MRGDINKLLCERERHGHSACYGDTRNAKALSDSYEYAAGGKQSMSRRHNIRGYTKSFNENLNPLKGWLHKCLGKNWDKCYSELRKTFDARSVINQHILQHLYDYIDTKAFLDDDGRVMTIRRYNTTIVPIKQSYGIYYVCPKSGVVKLVNKQPRKSVIAEQEAEKQRKIDAVFRVYDKDTHLHLIDGIWYAFTLKDMPEAKSEYVKPYGVNEFIFGYGGARKTKTWDELNEQERKYKGVLKVTAGHVTDVLTGKLVYRNQPYVSYRAKHDRNTPIDGTNIHAQNRYHAVKQTASQKMLKKLGLIGTAAANDDCVRSHRDLARYAA